MTAEMWWASLARMISGLIGLLFLLSAGYTEAACDAFALTAEQRAWLDAHPDIVLGMTDQYPPELIRAGDGELSGILIDVLDLLNQRLGSSIRLQADTSSPTLIEEARAGRLDGLLAVAQLPVWDDQFLLTDSYFETYLYLYARDGVSLVGTDLAALSGQRVGTLQDHKRINALLAPVAEDMEHIEFSSNEALAAALIDGRIDVAVAPGTFDWWRRQNTMSDFGIAGVLEGSEYQIAMAIRKDWAPLVNILNLGLASISNDEWIAILSHWVGGLRFARLSRRLTLTEDERRWLDEHPVIRYGISAWAPIEYIDTEGQPAGIAPDYLRQIEALLGVRFEPQTIELWPEALDALADGNLDLLPAAMPRRQDRQGPCHFTAPYLRFPVAIFARVETPLIDSLRRLAGKRVLVSEGYATEEWLRAEHPEIDLVLAPDVRTAVRWLAEGRADALVGNLFAVSQAITLEELFQVRVAGHTDYTYELAMATRPDWDILNGLLERAIAAIPVSEQDAIKSRWLSAQPVPRIDTRLVWQVTLAVALVVAVILAWNLSLARQIQRRRRAEERLGASEQRYRGMVESASSVLVFYCLDKHGVVLDAGAGTLELFGMQEHEMLGRNWRDIAAWSGDSLVLGQRALATCWLGQAPAPVTLTYELDGERRHLISFPHPVKDDNNRVVRIEGLNVNLTERLRLEEEVRELETDFRTLFELSPLPIVISSGDEERVLMVNQRFRDLVGYEIDEIPDVARWWPKAYPDPQYRQQIEAEWQQKLARAMTTQSPLEPMEAQVRCGDGQTRIFIFHATSLRQRQLVMFVDVTEQRATEARLRAAQEKAEAANRAKNEFLANVSHEIRTPMNAILGMQYLCLETELDQRQREYLTKAQSATNALLGLLNDILDVSKIEAGHLRLDAQPFALSQVLDQLLDIVGRQAEDQGLGFLIDCAPEVPEALYGDALRLNQILLNLANNALKFTEQGDIRIDARQLERLPAAAGQSRERVHLEFRVRDTGIGLSEEQIATVFQPFQQADGSITRRYGGTGLGLSICKRLVTLMGGAIGVDSKPGEGSTFWFTIWSQCLRADEQPVSQQPQRLTQAPRGLAGRRMLLVEDNPVNREVARAMLERAGIIVSEAEQGVAALAQLSEQGCEAFDLVLMDIQMPEMGGLEATRRIRARPDGTRLPIIGLSAHVRDEDVTRAREAGMNAHLGKPLDVARLYGLLAEQLGLNVDSCVGDGGERPTDALELPAISGLDPAALSVALGPNFDMWPKLLRLFEYTHIGSLARIDAALAAGDIALAESHAHSLAGAAGNLGLVEIGAAARALEDVLRDQPPADVALAEARVQLADQLEPALAAIAAWRDQVATDQTAMDLGATQAPAEPPTAVSRERLEELLARLYELTQAHDPRAEDLLLEENILLHAGLDPDQYRRLERQITGYRFAAASDTLAQLRET
ncbi:transporter substrate-binding domain-containing protein [Thiorhodovibrio frisius]|uniref:Sensory/regulatory protein RpfC n=1 Tax=Thiorhodovibrio frisius TaxID=631362 RepID=H8Z5K8_9GAMM|nr:transporter substrate-binding domain-containing protein [Thiorhodovibrio frisius]EIC20578.1 PAS domain S-box [Thiorhodovibrio frisius]WPL21326.1 Sensory/regulatory protein RpfC [Thiorhodovibrio frisius]